MITLSARPPARCHPVEEREHGANLLEVSRSLLPHGWKAGIGLESHPLPWQGRFGEPPPLCEPPDALERMRHRLKTRAGRASYGQRKQTVEPVFGIAGMRFRQFLLRGLEAVRADWSLVTMAWNIRRMAVLKG